MSNINKKQAFNLLKKSLENFNFTLKSENCSNEAQTKKFLIDPFFMLLNYAHDDLIPEYNADFGDRVSNKVDYAIKLNKKDIIIIECKKLHSRLTDKEAGQLSGYFQNAKNSRVAILTNGKEYRFYSDIEINNTMDTKPFFIFDIENYNDSDIDGLLDFDKRLIDIGNIVSNAKELVFIDDFERTFLDLLFSSKKETYGKTSSELIKLIHKSMTFKMKVEEGKMNDLINSSLLKSIHDKILLYEVKSNSKNAGIITTEEETQAYHTIRTLLIQNKKIPNSRITFKDLKGSFNVIVDDNLKKVICQLKFTDNSKKILIGASSGFTNDINLDNIDDILKYKNELTNRTLELIES